MRWAHFRANPDVRTLSKFIFLTLTTGVCFGALFWIVWGRSLHYSVYADDQFWYSEDFTELGKILVTVGFSLVFGLGVSFVALIIQKFFRAGHN